METEKAKHAYRAMKIIAYQESAQSEQQKNVDTKIVERAMNKYNYTGKTGEKYVLNSFVTALYDALLLYAIAMNETLEEQGSDRWNGSVLTTKMWNRSFVGFNGNVLMDCEGFRCSNLTILHFANDRFEEAAYYDGSSNQIRQITNLQWIGGKAPVENLFCGYEHCPGYQQPLHVYAAVVCLAILATFLINGFAFIYGRYRAIDSKLKWRGKPEEEEF